MTGRTQRVAGLAVLLGAASGQAKADTYYDAPFRYTLACVSNHPPYPSVDAAVSAWWEQYTSCWSAFFPCGYSRHDYGDGISTGVFADMTLTGNCSGGDAIIGTPYQYNPRKNGGDVSCPPP